MKPITCLFFFYFILISIYSYSQNNLVASIKKQPKETTSQAQKKVNGKSTTTPLRSINTVDNFSRPFYMNTIISSKDSIAENRVIKIIGDELSADGFLFEVKNRWGNTVYECQSLNQMITTGWDGKQNEVLHSLGIYSFIVHYQNTNGEKFKKSGFITIE